MDRGIEKARLILPEGKDIGLDVITDNMGKKSIDIVGLRASTGYITYDPGATPRLTDPFTVLPSRICPTL